MLGLIREVEGVGVGCVRSLKSISSIMQKRVEGIIGTWAALTLRVALLAVSPCFVVSTLDADTMTYKS